METMDIFVLPTEILLRVFSYLPQKELFTTVDRVCNYWNQLCLSRSLWTDIHFHGVYDTTKQASEHFRRIQSYVIKLVIKPNSISELFDQYKSLEFFNLKKLDISAEFVLSGGLLDTIAMRCPKLNDLRLRIGIENMINVEHCFSALSRFCLDAIYIAFDDFTQNIDKYLDILISKQPILQKLSIYAKYPCSFIKDKTVEKLLYECRGLKSLILSDTQMSGRAFTHSMQPLELTELDIYSFCISDFELKYITLRAKQLRSLNIEQCKKITDDGLCHVGNCQFLETFCFGNIKSSGDTTHHSNCGLISVAEGCKNMKYFASIGWRTLDDDNIIQLVQSCKNLSYISIKWCESLTDASLIAISEHCEYLSEVNFEFCHNISLTGIMCLISSCKQLLRLSLYHCLGISDGVPGIKDKANEPTAEFNNTGDAHEGYSTDSMLDNTTKSAVSDERKLGHTECRYHHSPLKELVLEWCKNISNSVVLKLAAMCPDLYKIIILHCKIDFVMDFFIELAQRCTVLSMLKT